MPTLKPVTKGFLLGALVLAVLAGYALLSLSNAKPGSVIRINSKNPALQAAIDEAKKGLPDFKKELAAPKPGEGFAIKGSFKTPEGPEYLWVRSPIYKSGGFTGTLDQQPIAVAGLHKGDQVTVAEKDAVDWLIKDDQGIRGEFTEKILQPK